jgi:ATPases involved in chromosome partitioning
MQKITFMNFKGGVGKTTSVCTMAELLGLAGYHVLIIDLDPQSNTSRMFGIKEDIEDLNYENLFCEKMYAKKSMQEFIVKTEYANIHMLPSSEKMCDIIYKIYDGSKEKPKDKNDKIELTFAKNIKLVEDDYDYIFIDTSPFKTYLSYCAILASDKVVTPISLDNFSYEGVLKLADLIVELNTNFKRNTEFMGVFFTKIKSKTSNLFTGMSGSYQEQLDDLFIPIAIRDLIAVAEANTAFQPLFTYNRKCPALNDYIELLSYMDMIDNKHYKALKNLLVTKKGGDR